MAKYIPGGASFDELRDKDTNKTIENLFEYVRVQNEKLASAINANADIRVVRNTTEKVGRPVIGMAPLYFEADALSPGSVAGYYVYDGANFRQLQLV